MAAAPNELVFKGSFQIFNVECAGRISISQDATREVIVLTAEYPVKLSTAENNKLTVTSKNGGGGSMNCITQMNYGGASYTSFGGNSVSVSGSNININSSLDHRDFNVTFNGKHGRIVLDGEDASAPKPVDPNYSTTWVIYNDKKLKTIRISGSSIVVFQTKMILEETLSVSITGSGDLHIPESKFISVNCVISGSGDISLHESTVQEFYATISGSGDIKHFHALNKVEATVSGSGDITGTCEKNCEIEKYVSGSGEIKVRKI